MKYILLAFTLIFVFNSKSYSQIIDSTEAAYYERMQAMEDSLYQDFQSKLDTIPRFKIKPAGWAGFNSPQRYGGEGFLHFGKFAENTEFMGKYSSSYNGVRIGGGLYRGGYRYTVGYFKYDSFIGFAGYSVNLTYLNNNSFARVRKGSEMIGLQAEFTVLFQVRVGVFKDLNDDTIIPTFGFGIPIGPKMYDY